MKAGLRGTFTKLSLLALTASVASTAHAAIVNGGFESGLTGWSAPAGSVFTVASRPSIIGPGDPAAPAWTPTEGASFGYLLARGTSPTSTPAATTLSQRFDASAGDVLSFDVFFDAGDYANPGNDHAYVSLTTFAPYSCNNPIFCPSIHPDVVSGDTLIWQQSVADVGDYGASGWTHLSFVLPQSLASGPVFQNGPAVPLGYVLNIGIDNVPDNANASALGIDNIGLNLPASTPVPLPPSLTLLLTGLGGMALIGRRRLGRQPRALRTLLSLR
jgi:hypothetical protein